MKLAGVIGWPIGQSRSPLIHTRWLAEHGVAGAYVPMAVRPEALEAALRGLAALGFAGCNVTVPHKEHASRLVDRLSETAARMGAVNLVVVEPDSSLTGHNTDGYGFLENLRESLPGWQAGAGPAVVLGAGGGARAVAASLLDVGCPQVRLANRSPARADALCRELGCTFLGWDAKAGGLAGAALLVNTTTQGMTGQPALDLTLDALPTDALVCDIVYNPLVTPLLAAASARGNPCADGLGMLLHQARPAFAAWFGIDPAVTPALRRLVAASIP